MHHFCFVCRWIKNVSGIFLLLFCGEALAQSPSMRLEATPALLRPQNTPVLDQTGICVGWFHSSRATLLDAEGRKLFQSNGKILQQLTNADGSIYAVLEKIEPPKTKAQESFFTLHFLNRSGQLNGSYHFSLHRDDPLPQIIFEATGEHLLIAHPASARLIFLQNNGQVLREISLFHEAPYTNERPLFIAAGTQAFILLSQKTPTTNTKTVAPTLIYFSNHGKEQWRRELPSGTAGGLAVSDNGAWIIANRYTVTDARVASTSSILNFQGEMQGTIDGLFRRAVFAKNGNSLLLLDRRQLRGVDFRSGKTLWQFGLTRRTEMFVEMAATARQDKIFALVADNVFRANRFVFENARLVSLNSAGQQQAETLLPGQLVAPVLKISSDGHRLTLGAAGFLQQFTVVESPR